MLLPLIVTTFAIVLKTCEMDEISPSSILEDKSRSTSCNVKGASQSDRNCSVTCYYKYNKKVPWVEIVAKNGTKVVVNIAIEGD